MNKKKTQSFILLHSLFVEKLIQLSNPQHELDFQYALRILTSNLQSRTKKGPSPSPSPSPTHQKIFVHVETHDNFLIN